MKIILSGCLKEKNEWIHWWLSFHFVNFRDFLVSSVFIKIWCAIYYEPSYQNTFLMPYVNNKGCLLVSVLMDSRVKEG